MSTYGGIYKAGTAAVTNNGTSVVGTGTMWSLPIEEGDTFIAQGLVGVINSVVDDTHLTLETGWPGATASGLSYVIVKNSALRADVTFVQKKVRELILMLQGQGLIYWVDTDEPNSLYGEDGQYAIKVTDNGELLFWKKVAGEWVAQGDPGAATNQTTSAILYLYEHCT